jgi:DNA-binding NtrC family response regulator
MSEDPQESAAISASARRRVVTQALNPPGLLLFSPLGTPPKLTFYPLDEGETVLGRTPDCTLRLNDDKVSRRHARILRRPDGVNMLEDLDSANGVFVDGQQVETFELAGGELLRLGRSLLRFLRLGTAQAQTQHAAHTQGLISGPSLDDMRGLLDRGASSKLSFFVTGEPGTGKELVARRLHRAGALRDAPFVSFDGRAVPASEVEATLFGRVDDEGDASQQPGLIRLADQGTLFLDAIETLPPTAQARLLRALVEHQVRPLGGSRAFTVVVRMVSATSQDLAAQVRQQTFRADLHARLAEVVVQLPPLRERFEDIPLLVGHFIAEHLARLEAATCPEVPAEVLEQLCLRPWPTNVRQLDQAVGRALERAAGASELTEEHFADAGLGPVPAAQEDRADPEAQALVEALRRHGGDTESAARELGISRNELYSQAKKHAIVAAHFKTI